MQPVFEYLDYRLFLHDFYESQKKESSYFSYRYISRKFCLNAAPGTGWNVEAFEPGTGNRALFACPAIRRGDTGTIEVQTVRKPGAVKFILTPAAAFNGYVYIPGTTLHAAIKDGIALLGLDKT